MDTVRTDVLLVPYGLAGHVGPMGVLGAALRARGHEVTVLVGSDSAAGFTRLGLATWAPRRWRADAPVPADVLAAGDTGAVFRHLILGSVADLTLDVEEALDATGAAIVVGDVFMPGAGLGAERAGVPWASLACSAVPAVDSYTIFIDPLLVPYFDIPAPQPSGPTPHDASATLAGPGRADRPASLLGRISPHLHLIPVTPRFAGAEAVAGLPEQVRLVGPLVPAGELAGAGRPWGVGPKGRGAGTSWGVGPKGRGAGTSSSAPPSIVVATSSNAWQRHGDGALRQQRSLRVAARALAGMDVSAVLIIPPGASTDLLGPPAPNVRRTGLLPPDEFDALIDGCSAVVSHGGWGTVARALMRGLPLVIMPTSIDQPYIAQRCHELGVGIALDPLTATPPQFRAAVEAVCRDAPYRQAALDFAAELRSVAPAETAAALVADLVTENLSTVER